MPPPTSASVKSSPTSRTRRRAAQAALNVITSRRHDARRRGDARVRGSLLAAGRRDGKAPRRTRPGRDPPIRSTTARSGRSTFLLQHQSDNGGFLDARYAYWPDPRIIPNTWMAITAIALTGLADWREVDPDRIDKALRRGEKFLFTAKNLAPGQNEECYADAFRLLYLKRRLASVAERLEGGAQAPRADERHREGSRRAAERGRLLRARVPEPVHDRGVPRRVEAVAGSRRRGARRRVRARGQGPQVGARGRRGVRLLLPREAQRRRRDAQGRDGADADLRARAPASPATGRTPQPSRGRSTTSSSICRGSSASAPATSTPTASSAGSSSGTGCTSRRRP